MSVFSGDFLGFQLGNIHSSKLNLTRVSSSDWYNETLSPNFSDLVATTPGVDGTYYWGTNYTQKNFTIDFAFDDVSDVDLKQIRRTFSFKGLKKLIFDEYPYKQYMVKCSSPPNFKFICFDHEEYRVYKGEGQAQLVSYYPFATSVEDQIIGYNKYGCFISNNGDMDCNMKLTFNIDDLSNGLTLTLDSPSGEEKILKLKPVSKKNENDKYVLIDTYTHLIEGLDEEFNKTNTLYNNFIESGDFFKAEIGINTLKTGGVRFEKGIFIPLYL